MATWGPEPCCISDPAGLTHPGCVTVSDFVPIKIIDLDESASTSDPNSSMANVVLRLNASAPSAWADYFNNRWAGHWTMVKRDARVSGSSLTTHCVPSQLKELVAEFTKIIDETNKAYVDWAAKQALAEKAKAVKAEQQKQSLRDARKDLGFGP
jgi:hypothetical protein